ncbi:S8 family serine peptidase [Marilutibacter spongiae]|nr:S8 family serine peptidase [Lysobacter spongiae]
MTSGSNPGFRRTLLAMATAGLLLGGTAAAQDLNAARVASAAEPEYDSFIVKYRAGTPERGNPAAMMRSLGGNGRSLGALGAGNGKGKALGFSHGRRLATGADLVRTDRKLDRVEAQAMMRLIAANPDVEYIQPNYKQRALSTPNDPRFAEQWHYANSATGARVPAAWDQADGSGVVVAVVDSGIVAHNDLNANILPGYDMVSSVNGGSSFECSRYGLPAGCGGSQDGNGRDADATDASASTTGVHGTHVAGTIAAVTNNGTGVAGIAFKAKVVPVRALGKDGLGDTADIADGIIWASGGSVAGLPANANPAEVINLSLGGDRPCSDTPAYQDAINTAIANGSVVVAAAGNSNIDVANATPASCNNVISVAASDNKGNRAFYSSWGATIDITAPGGETCSPSTEFLPLNQAPSCTRSHDEEGVLSTVAGNGYAFFQGTSMATPHVAGIVALIQSAASTPKTPAQIRTILADTARPIAASKCPGGCGPGLIDAAAAVAAVTGNDPVDPPTDPVDPGRQTYANTADVGIRDYRKVESAISVSGRSGKAPTDAVIRVDIRHTYRGDLRVDLVAPDGSAYLLANRSGGGTDNIIGSATLDLSSETLNGTWKLRVNDNAGGDVGYINEWSLTF